MADTTEKPQSRMVGGTSEEKTPDVVVQEIVQAIRPELEKKLGRTFADFTPISFRDQLVNGVNYFIKLNTGNDTYVHVRAHRSFQGAITLHSYQTNKQRLDEISYFEQNSE